jgi:hypothetical protein
MPGMRKWLEEIVVTATKQAESVDMARVSD